MSRWRDFFRALGGGVATSNGTPTVSDPYAAGWKPTKKGDLPKTFGAPGTLNFDGYLTDIDEYNPDFYVNERAFRIFEQMRRGDPQVYALLASISLPIRSARWDVSAPETSPTQTEKEAAALVKENLFGGLEYVSPHGATVSQSFDEVLQHLLLMLSFGSSAMEEIWAIEGDTIRLARLAPRMPRTYYRWHSDDDGETLLVLEQHAYRGANLQFWKTPADKLTIASFQKEGAYFAGRSLLRSVYPPYFYKNGMLKVEAIAAERNAMGIPIGKHAPDASEEDVQRLNTWVTQISTQESTGMALPNGADFELVGVKGRLFDCGAAITRHNQEITRAGLASFLDLGSSATGSRAVGDTLSDFFFLSEQALAGQIEWALNTACVRRLVNLNYPGVFGRDGLRYPRVTAANVKVRSIQSVMQYLDKLAQARVIQPDDVLENDLRREFGLPKADPSTARVVGQAIVQERVETMSDAPGPGSAPAKTPGGGPAESAKPGKEAAKVASQVAAESRQLSAGGIKFAREPRGAEIHVEHAALVEQLDGGKLRIATILRNAKKQILWQLAAKMQHATPAEIQAVSLPLDAGTIGRVAHEVAAIHAFGRQSVQREMAAQRGKRTSARAAQLAAGDGGGDGGGDAGTTQLVAETTVADFQNQLAARAAAVALAAAKAATPLDAAALAAKVNDQTDGWVDRDGGEAANLALSNGRQDGFKAVRDQIDRFIYSALLDQNTCEPCSDADGKEGTEDDLPPCPNPDCAGSLCRCMWVAVFKDEGSHE